MPSSLDDDKKSVVVNTSDNGVSQFAEPISSSDSTYHDPVFKSDPEIDWEEDDYEDIKEDIKEEDVEKRDIQEKDLDSPFQNQASNKRTKVKIKPSSPQIFIDLQTKTQEALDTFVLLKECTYSNKTLGKSGQDEAMTCDCREEWNGSINSACGDDSECINRLTSIECVNGKCNCGDDCRNQRFQTQQYAPVDVIQTEKKGYGLRALEDLAPGTFVYEYVGEVIDEPKFRKKMKQYEEQGIRHFYFMMLQKGEFIDATTKGCLARFCNHSCNPNSFVDKWVVADKLRMGIFTKRHVFKGEEITFDYNVDRYGSQAQPCYCGEPNCIGYLGGKTQTEAASKLPQLLIDALGLDEQDESQWLTTTAKRKKKGTATTPITTSSDDYAVNLPVKPVDLDSVSKVMSSLLQCREEWLINKLISRIHITSDELVDSKVMQMHGYQIFSVLLREWTKTEHIVVMILEILLRWPRVTKNKISSSKIESTVKTLSTESQLGDVRQIASQLLAEWSSLQMAYRIPRRERIKAENSATPLSTESSPAPKNERDSSGEAKETTTPTPKSFAKPSTSSSRKKSLNGTSVKYRKSKLILLPPGWESAYDKAEDSTYYFNRSLNISQWDPPKNESEADTKAAEALKHQMSLQKIIEDASKQAQLVAEQNQQIADAVEKSEAVEDKVRVSSSRSSKERYSSKSNAPIDRILTKTFAKYVPNVVARYQKDIGKDGVKKHSRDIVHILIQKELKPGHAVRNPSELSKEKKTKIKAFINSYMIKVMDHQVRKKSKDHNPDTDVGTTKINDNQDSDEIYQSSDHDEADSLNQMDIDSNENQDMDFGHNDSEGHYISV